MAHPPIELREADWRDERERQCLLRLRFAVFVDEQGVPADMEVDEHELDATHFVASEPGGAALGCVRLTRGGKVTRLCVLAAARGRGVGRALLRRAIDEGHRQGFTELRLHAQTHASAFYEREGFAPEGDVFMEAGIPHQLMVRREPPA